MKYTLSAIIILVFFSTGNVIAGKCSDCHTAFREKPFRLAFSPIIDSNSLFYSPCIDYNHALWELYDIQRFMTEREIKLGYIHRKSRKFKEYSSQFQEIRDLFRDFRGQPIISLTDFQNRSQNLRVMLNSRYGYIRSAEIRKFDVYVYAGLIIIALFLTVFFFQQKISRNLYIIVLCIEITGAVIFVIFSAAPKESGTAQKKSVTLLDSLQKTVDEMTALDRGKGILVEAALMIDEIKLKKEWLDSAESKIFRMQSIWTDDVMPILDAIQKSEKKDFSAEMVSTLEEDAYTLISPPSMRDYYMAKIECGFQVDQKNWDELVDEISSIEDSFKRNAYLEAFAEALEPYDLKAADKFLGKVDHPYFRYVYGEDIEYESANYTPEINFDILLQKYLNEYDQDSRSKIFMVLVDFTDSMTRGYYAARIVEKVTDLNEEEFLSMLELAKAGGPALEAKCWTTYMFQGNASEKFAGKAYTRFAVLPDLIEDAQARNEMLFWQGYFISQEFLAAGLDFFTMVQPESMYQFGLEAIAFVFSQASDREFSAIMEKTTDNSAILNSYLSRLERLELNDAVIADALTKLNSLVDQVNYSAPKMRLAEFWAEYSPSMALECMNWFENDEDYVKTLVILTRSLRDANPEDPWRLIVEKYDEIIASSELSPYDKSGLIVELADVMISIDKVFAFQMLESAVEQ